MLNMKRKSQAAMEFLMTYGWALLVVIIVIVALAWFGLLNPNRFLPEKCDLGTPGLTCADFSMNTTHVIVLIKNNLGKDMLDFSLTVSDKNNVFGGGIKPGDMAKFDLNYSYTTKDTSVPLFHAGQGVINMKSPVLIGNSIFDITGFATYSNPNVSQNYGPIDISDGHTEYVALRFRH